MTVIPAKFAKTTGLALFAAALLSAAPVRAEATEVGFSELRIANGQEKPLVVGVWYPTAAPAQDHPLGAYVQTVAPSAPVAGEHLPLIVMSHGNGGNYQNNYDTALALAKAGFVAVAVSHTGDTHEDQSRAVYVMDRPQHMHRLIDYMLSEWPDHTRLDAGRVGVFGFSIGGFTALVAVGGIPDLSFTEAHAKAHPEYYDAQVAKRRGASPEALAMLRSKLPASTWVHDSRIKAAVVAAPALGYTFGREGMKDVTVPVQLWRAAEDHILPHPDYAEAVRIALPAPPEYHVVDNADHFDFLAPCTDMLRQVAPMICVSRSGFDRTRFHQTFNAEVVRFFQETLKVK
ncbi:MAG: dienelactone hydrolase family protein [Bradyrhizobium sp.]|uniref:alpha/beta hydrolase family protein n=1 Tax=Bradyrhizobium sp. TaxID=376 RepID=UPI003C3CBA94